jgi:hypothetical protein
LEREREIQNLKLLQHVAEFTNEAGKSFKPNCLKNFNTKKEAEDF